MVSILICDDDIVMLNRIKSVIELVLADSETKAKIHAFSDAEQISGQILSACDIALLDIDFDKANYGCFWHPWGLIMTSCLQKNL